MLMSVTKILDLLDFAKGYKTKVSGAFLLIVLLLNYFGYEADKDTIEEGFWSIFDQLDVIVGAIGVIYGLAMKAIRYLRNV